MRKAAKRGMALLCAAALLWGLAGCGGADTLPDDAQPLAGGALPDGETQGGAPAEAENIPVQEGYSFDARDADNANLVPLNNGTMLAGCTAAGGERGFYQTVLSGDGAACYILYTDYATGSTRWLEDESGNAVKLPANGSEFAVLPAGGTVFLLRLGLYEWGGERTGGAVYTMKPDGSELQLVLELDEEMERRIFWPASAIIYDGEGIYCNVAHYNGAKGTADMMLMYIYEDDRYPVEMKYYPMEGEVPLLAGSFGGTMVLRTAVSEEFWGPGTVQDYEATDAVYFAYSLYNYGSGTQSDTMAGYEGGSAAGFLHRDRLYVTHGDGDTYWYDFSRNSGENIVSGIPHKGVLQPARITAGSYMAVWDNQLMVCAGDTAYRLDVDSGRGWQRTDSYSNTDYSGAVWAADGGYYVVAANEAETEYYTAGMPLFGLDGEPEEAEEEPDEPEEEPPAWVTDTAVPVWLVWPFPEERPTDMTLFLLAEAEGYWDGLTQRVPLLPN